MPEPCTYNIYLQFTHKHSVSHTIRDVQNVDNEMNKWTLKIKRHQISDRSYSTYRQLEAVVVASALDDMCRLKAVVCPGDRDICQKSIWQPLSCCIT